MMSSLQLATSIPVPRFTYCSFSSPIEECSIAGKRTGKGPKVGFFSPIPHKSCLAAISSDKGESGVELAVELMPKHVSIIMDGNGRWATKKEVPVQEGHQNGRSNLKSIISNASNLGIKLLSVFAFSTENWRRSKMEADSLMRIFEDFIRSDVTELIKRKEIRFSAIGNIVRLPESLQDAISSAEEMSRNSKGMHFVMAMSYSGRNDIVEAAKEIATKVERGILRPDDVDEATFEQHLMTNITQFPNPDLVIRTSGELRVSNFLLWQLAYTEFYVADTLFPDFGEADLVEALASYQRRQRRYGERKESTKNLL